MSEVAELFNKLFDFESKNRSMAYPIHKKLDLGDSHDDILDWVMSKVDFSKKNNVLDAGCGTGYSLVKLVKEKGVSGRGISLSQNEVDFAQSIAINESMEDQVSFEKKNFDTPFSGFYDRIIAIESLKHSENLQQCLSNLNNTLANGGFLIFADDYILNSSSKLFSRHKQLWHAPSYCSSEEFIQILNKISNLTIKKYNLTDQVYVRPLSKINALVSLIQILTNVTFGSLKRNLKTYLGCLLLEKLYISKEMNYLVFIIKKGKY